MKYIYLLIALNSGLIFAVDQADHITIATITPDANASESSESSDSSESEG